MKKIIYIISITMFLITLNSQAEAKIKAKRAVKALILTLNDFNDNVSSYGNPPNFPCEKNVLYTSESDLSKEDFEKANLSFFNFIQSLVNDSEVDQYNRKITQNKVNQMVAMFEHLHLKSEDLDKIILMVGSSKNIPLKDRAQVIGAINDIKSVKNIMNEYLDLGSDKCYFLYDNNMKNNLGKDSIFYNHEKLSEKDREIFDLNSEDIIVAGRCKGRGLLILPEMQNP